MKVVYLIRHAKSEGNNPSIIDFNRVLSPKGLEDAQLMAIKLKELHVQPELIVCSSAQRTISTKQIIGKQINNLHTNIILDPSIYEASLNYLTFLVNALPSKSNHVIIIGHNPGITLLSNYLTDDLIDNIPACGVVKIELNIENWNEIIQGIGTIRYFIYPEISL